MSNESLLEEIAMLRENERHLTAANERLQMALAASGVVGLWDWMVDTDLLHGDANFARLYGLDPEKTAAGVTMEEYQEFVLPQDLDSLRSDIRATFERGADFLVEYRLAIPSEPLRWIECKGRLIHDDTGRAVRFSGTAVDVTRRKMASEAAKANEMIARRNAERVQLALAAGAIIGTWVWDLPTNIFRADEAFARACGLDPELARKGLTPEQAGETVHPDDLEGLAAAITEAIDRGGPYVHQYRTRRADGNYYWLEANGQVEHAEDGTPLRFPGVLLDIEARRAVEAERDRAFAELRRLNDTLEQQVAARTAERDRMWETSPDLLLVIDFDGIFRRVNPTWTKLLGYEPDELIGHHVNEFVLEDHHVQTRDAYELAAAGGSPRLENCYRHKDGSTRWISWVAAPAGNVTYATGRDVTVERARAAALAEAQEALRQSQKMEAVGQLTGGLAHDFNNLLAGISGSLELIQNRMRDGRHEDMERYLSTAQNGAKRAASLTQRLLAFSRRQTLDPKPANVDRLVSDMQELIERTVGPSIDIEVRGASDLWPALVDASQLESALLNLCVNARDAMPDGGRITIETANERFDGETADRHNLPKGDYLSLCVTDTGTGMSPDTVQKAFEPFFTTKPLGEGTGLGLSMVYGFAKQSGGQVEITSEIGAGTTICVYLPRYQGTIEDEKVSERAAPSPSPTGNRTVLVVNDEVMVRMLIVDVLEELGYTVIEAGDGASSLEILRSDTPIDLLISDVGLPGGMNGRQMADAARQVRPELGVLFVTGYAENALADSARTLPGMQVITKPFELDAFARRVRAMIEQ